MIFQSIDPVRIFRMCVCVLSLFCPLKPQQTKHVDVQFTMTLVGRKAGEPGEVRTGSIDRSVQKIEARFFIDLLLYWHWSSRSKGRNLDAKLPERYKMQRSIESQRLNKSTGQRTPERKKGPTPKNSQQIRRTTKAAGVIHEATIPAKGSLSVKDDIKAQRK